MEQKIKISSELSGKVLTIGPEYRHHRGGIGALIAVYSKYYQSFNYIKSHNGGSILSLAGDFMVSILKLFFVLSTNRKIKIIHIHGASYGSFYRKLLIFTIAKFLYGKRIIYHIHGGEYHLFYKNSKKVLKKLIRYFISNAHFVITLSESWEIYFKENFKPRLIEILPNIIDYPVQIIPKSGSGPVSLVFLGRIGQRKGIYDVLKLLQQYKSEYFDKIIFTIGGDGETRYIEQLIDSYKISGFVNFIGWVDEKQKKEILGNSDIYLLPSYNEGLPISILEAMSYGMAIISTNVGGISEIVKDHENGILITPGDTGELKDAIDFFIQNRELIYKYGAVSRQKVRPYLPESVIPRLINIYESVLAGG